MFNKQKFSSRSILSGTTEKFCYALYRLPDFFENLEEMSLVLSSDEKSQIFRIRNEFQKKLKVVIRSLQKILLAELLGISTKELTIQRNSWGKPYFNLGSKQPFLFNFSDCDEFLFFGYSDNFEIGVDMESFENITDHDSIARRFFNPRELEQFETELEELRPYLFLSWWTQKEAVVKALGIGLGTQIKDFAVLMTLKKTYEKQVISIEGKTENIEILTFGFNQYRFAVSILL